MAAVLTRIYLLVDNMKSFPEDRRLSPQIPKILGLKNPTLREVDTELTRVLGGDSPPFPFKTVDDYCKRRVWLQRP